MSNMSDYQTTLKELEDYQAIYASIRAELEASFTPLLTSLKEKYPKHLLIIQDVIDDINNNII